MTRRFAILLALWLAPLVAQQPPADTPVDVEFRGKRLFTLHTRLAALSTEERRDGILLRMRRLVENTELPLEPVRYEQEAGHMLIFIGNMAVAEVTTGEARAAGLDIRQLAETRALIILEAVQTARHSFGRRALLFGLLWAFIGTIAALGVLYAMRRLFPVLYSRIQSWEGTVFRTIRFQKIEIVTAQRLAASFLRLAHWVRLAATATLIFFWLTFVLSQFPYTSGYTVKLLGYLMEPARDAGLAILDYLPNLFSVIVIALFVSQIVRLTRYLFVAVAREKIVLPGFQAEWARPTYKLVRFLILMLGLVIVHPYLPGSKSPAFQGVSIFIGLMLSLGSSSAVANVVAGTILTYTRAFKIGDRVRIAETEGDIIEKPLIATRIRTNKNVEVSIPNSMVMGAHIVNYSSSAASRGLVLHSSVTIGFDVPWRQVHALLIAAARDTDGIIDDPPPFVLQTSLDDFYVSYQVTGVEIMSPHYRAQRDGNATTIPAEFGGPD